MNHLDKAIPTAQVLSQALGFKESDPRSELLAFAKLTQMIECAEQEAKSHLEYMWDTVAPHYAGIRYCFARLPEALNGQIAKPSSLQMT